MAKNNQDYSGLNGIDDCLVSGSILWLLSTLRLFLEFQNKKDAYSVLVPISLLVYFYANAVCM
jgi:hypothetical protein